MALDGIMIACMAKELNERIAGGRIAKIAQPEADALMLTIKNQKNTFKMFLSAGASLPLVYSACCSGSTSAAAASCPCPSRGWSGSSSWRSST